MLFAREAFEALGGFDEKGLLAEEYMLSRKVPRTKFAVIPGRIGQTIHWSDAQVFHLIAAARRVRDHTPRVWQAFREGRIDGAKAREISSRSLSLSARLARCRLGGRIPPVSARIRCTDECIRSNRPAI